MRIAVQSEINICSTVKDCWPIRALHFLHNWGLMTNQSSPFGALLKIADQSELSICRTIEGFWPIKALRSPHDFGCWPIRALHSPHYWWLLTNQSSPFASLLRISDQSELSICCSFEDCCPIRVFYLTHCWGLLTNLSSWFSSTVRQMESSDCSAILNSAANGELWLVSNPQ